MFFFQDDPLERLDAYQHIGTVQGRTVQGISSSEARRLVALANCGADAYSWSDIRTYPSLQGRVFRLEEDDPEQPVLIGQTQLPEGMTRSCSLTLSPLIVGVTLQTLCCDFTGRPYAGTPLRNVRAYLTYASGECHPLDTAWKPALWLNAGHLDEAETAALPRPGMLLGDIAASVGGLVRPGKTFHCYPNPSDGSEFGAPATRLVIEGELLGETCYYPIDLPGLEAGMSVQLDVTLTRAGSPDPDIPARTGTILLDRTVLDWDERRLDDIHFRRVLAPPGGKDGHPDIVQADGDNDNNAAAKRTYFGVRETTDAIEGANDEVKGTTDAAEGTTEGTGRKDGGDKR